MSWIKKAKAHAAKNPYVWGIDLAAPEVKKAEPDPELTLDKESFLAAAAEPIHSATISSDSGFLEPATLNLHDSFADTVNTAVKEEIAKAFGLTAEKAGMAAKETQGLAEALKDVGKAMQEAGVSIKSLQHKTDLKAQELPLIEFHIEAYFDGKNPEIAEALHALYAWANSNHIPF